MITITLFHHTFAFSVTTFPFSFILFSRITYDLSPHITHFLIFKFANSLIILSPFRRHIPPSPWERDGVRILFLSPRNPLLTFLPLLYYIMNQLFIYPFYTNRPRFV